jgi:peptide-methionine (S)-S-oxide reductase
VDAVAEVAGDAGPRRGLARPRGEDAGAGRAFRQRPSPDAAFPRRARDGGVRARLLLGRPGVYSTAVGYAGGRTPNPTYEEVCSGATGHTEAVLVVFDPKAVSYDTLLKTFWESHDPTQGMRQGNDVGTQYRSAIYWTTPEQKRRAEASRALYQQALNAARGGEITTEMRDAADFYYAEDYHQQYLAKNPNGYCGLGGTGVSCPVPMAS